MTPPITLFRTPAALLAQRGEDLFQLPSPSLDALFAQEDPARWLQDQLAQATPVAAPEGYGAPIESQEVWAAGVTYLRSRDARIEESQASGGATFYDKVYAAPRPELFFKATPHRVVGSGGTLRLRADSRWNVPEPELVLALNRHGKIFGYTIGNDLSSRDIEGENPLYLPQAKVFRACCGLGPGLVVRDPLPSDTEIQLHIWRGGAPVFSGKTALDQMKRTLPELAEWLTRSDDFPHGCYLFTGTGIVPPDDFSLTAGDEVRIHIAGLGLLVNVIA